MADDKVVKDSPAAKLAAASKGDADQIKASIEAAKDAAEARDKEQKAVEKAAPTGKDFPERAAENIEGHQTAGKQPIPDKHKNSTAQTEPAILARDGGSVPHAMVATPTGLVPASAAGGAEGLAKYAAALKQSEDDGKITEEKLLTMNKHDIRAAAHDRGYRIGEGSVRSLTRRFLEEQDKSAPPKK
jgi:hypothetical protein